MFIEALWQQSGSSYKLGLGTVSDAVRPVLGMAWIWTLNHIPIVEQESTSS